jgi:hypothetical protein
VFAAHSTHCCVTELHSLAWAGQLLAEVHPTQTPMPELVSHVGAFFGQSALPAHAAWQS